MKQGYISISNIRKDLFKISQVCKILNLTPRTLRYYESLGLLPTTKRSRGKMRLYTEQDISQIKKIRALKEQGVALSDIKQQLGIKEAELKKIKIFIDSTFSIPPAEVYAAGFDFIPMNINFGIYSYKDYLTLSPERFVELEEGKRLLAGSSAPSEAEYLEIFQKALAASDCAGVISLHPDSRISGSYTSALAAVKKNDLMRVKVVDTKLLSCGFGFVFNELCVEQNLDFETVSRIIKRAQNSITEIILIHSLERFLPKESAASPLSQMLFAYIPVLQHTAQCGFVPVGRFDTPSEACEYLMKQKKKKAEYRIAFSDTKTLEQTKILIDTLGVKKTIQYSSVVMSNLGRRLIGLAMKI